MQSSNAPNKISLPFAASGTKNTIPTASQIGVTPGAASLTDGFPPLTMTPLAAGGVPPAGADFNGILNLITAIQQWQSAGGSFKYDSAFSTSVGGYPKGAVLVNATNDGMWLNLADNNATNPDATDGSAANWAPVDNYGVTSIALTNANVTLTPAQFSKPIIVLTGTLTGNVQLTHPKLLGQWYFVNATTGAYTVQILTASGTPITLAQGGAAMIRGDGANVNIDALQVSPATQPQHAVQLGQVQSMPAPIQSVGASVASNALTMTWQPQPIAFRNGTLTSGAPVTAPAPASPLSLTVPSGATLGTVSGQAATLMLLVAYNGGSPVACVANLAGGIDLGETNLISPTTISGSATSASTIYSASAVAANSPYRVVGIVQITEATAGTWATAPTLVQGIGGQAMAALQSIGFGQTWQNVAGSRALGTTYYNTTSRPIFLNADIASTSAVRVLGVVNGVQVQSAYAASGADGIVAIVIPPGASYSITNGTTVNAWAELR